MKSQSRSSGEGLLVRRVRSRLALRKCFVDEATRSLTFALLSQFRRNHWRSRLVVHCHEIGPYRIGRSVPSLEVPGHGIAGGRGYTLCESLPNLKACVWRIFHALCTRHGPPICNIACPGPVVSLGPHIWIPRSKELHCVPVEQQSADRLPLPQHQSLFSAPSHPLFICSSFVCFSCSFAPPYYELVELGTTTLGWKLGIMFAQRLLLPSDEPKNAGAAAMRQRCSAVCTARCTANGEKCRLLVYPMPKLLAKTKTGKGAGEANA